MDLRVFAVALVAALFVWLGQSGVLTQFQKNLVVFLTLNWWVGWFVLPAVLVAYFLFRRGAKASNLILSPEQAMRAAFKVKGDEFLESQYALIKQYYRAHPRLPMFLWDASKPNALLIRNYITQNKKATTILGKPDTICVGMFNQQAPNPAGLRVAFIGQPSAILNLLGRGTFGETLTQVVGYSPDQRAFEQFERLAESGDELAKQVYGQVAVNQALRTLTPETTPTAGKR